MGESLAPRLGLRHHVSDRAHPGTETPGSAGKMPRNSNTENKRSRHFTTSEHLTLPSIHTFCILKTITFYPSYCAQLHQQSLFIRCRSSPFTYKMENYRTARSALVSGMQLLLAPRLSWGSWCVTKGNMV